MAQVDALIAREAERGIPPQRLLLAGFSQGGAITLAAGLARTQPLAGLIALSTYLPMPLALAQQRLQPQAAAQPLFMAHGSFDPVVPVAAGEAGMQALRGFGFDPQWHALSDAAPGLRRGDRRPGATGWARAWPPVEVTRAARRGYHRRQGRALPGRDTP